MFQTLWVLLSYSYNVILVLFIAAHLFVGAIISFLMGLYIGVYLTQNFQIPRINEPRRLWEKFLDYLEKNRRDPHKVSVTNILRPSTMKELVLEQKSILLPTSQSTEMEAVKGVTTGETTLADCQDESQTKIETDFVEDEAYLEEEYEDEEEEIQQVTETDKETHNTTETPKLVDLRSNYRTTSVIFTGSELADAAEHFRSFSPTNSKQLPSTYSANRLSYD